LQDITVELKRDMAFKTVQYVKVVVFIPFSSRERLGSKCSSFWNWHQGFDVNVDELVLMDAELGQSRFVWWMWVLPCGAFRSNNRRWKKWLSKGVRVLSVGVFFLKLHFFLFLQGEWEWTSWKAVDASPSVGWPHSIIYAGRYALLQGGLYSCGRQENKELPLETKLDNSKGTVALITVTYLTFLCSYVI
jgi:hypothetical protein